MGTTPLIINDEIIHATNHAYSNGRALTTWWPGYVAKFSSSASGSIVFLFTLIHCAGVGSSPRGDRSAGPMYVWKSLNVEIVNVAPFLYFRTRLLWMRYKLGLSHAIYYRLALVGHSAKFCSSRHTWAWNANIWALERPVAEIHRLFPMGRCGSSDWSTEIKGPRCVGFGWLDLPWPGWVLTCYCANFIILL